MSLSGLIEQPYLYKLAVLEAILEKYHLLWAGASTLESKLRIEADAIALYNQIIDNDISLGSVNIFEHPDYRDIENTYHLTEMVLKANGQRISKLNELYLDRINAYQLNLSNLLGKIRTIRQKLAVLGLWDNDIKYAVANRFLSINEVNSQSVSKAPLVVHPSEGLLTLPILSKNPIPAKQIRIGSDSNGQLGNSNIDVDLTNQNLTALISPNNITNIEYERLDNGPCLLSLILEFNQPSVVNHIRIASEAINSYDVTDVIFITPSGESVSLSSLLPTLRSSSMMQINDIVADQDWELTFLPIEVTSIALHFSQSQSHIISVANSDGSVSNRDRYSIELQYIECSTVIYASSGAINSVAIPIKNNLFAFESVVRIEPSDYSLFDFRLEVSFDDGVNWKQVSTDKDATLLLVEKNKGSFIWRLNIERRDQAFSSITSFYEPDGIVGDIHSLLRTVSRFNSPVSIKLPTEISNANVFAIQPKILRRGLKENAMRIGVTGPGTTKIRLPINLLTSDISPDRLHVFIAGTEYEQKKPGETLSAVEFSFSDDHNELLIPEDVPSGSIVEIVIDEEPLLLEERVDGYYHQMRFLFDPDKNNIHLHYLAREPSRTLFTLPRGQTLISLGKTNLIPDTLELVSLANTIYTEVDNRDDVYDAVDNDYYVDYVNGVLYLATAIGDDDVQIAFDYQERFEFDAGGFDIIYDEQIPWGIKVAKDALAVGEIEELVGDDSLSIIDKYSGEYGLRAVIIPNGSATKKQLNYDYIIKNTLSTSTDLFDNGFLPEEVEYIDGITEFLGLTVMDQESTTSITADANGVVSFALGARALWYRPLGILFSNTTVFNTVVASLNAVISGANGDYYVADDGTVSIHIGVGNILQADIKFVYNYKNPEYDSTNKYSVNYKDGVLYSRSAFNDEAVVRYKTANYTVGYDIAKTVPSIYSAEDNTVEINTEVLNPINNLVKVLWTVEPESTTLSNIQQYFTPLISLIGFRFS